MGKIKVEFAFILLLATVAFGCQKSESRVWIRSIPATGWEMDSALNFSFRIKELDEKVDFLYQVQYRPTYDFENIWLKYWLIGPKKDTLIRSRDNLFLFQPKTGVPLGIGPGTTKFLDAYFLKGVSFKDTGLYQIRVRHYMRTRRLEGIQSLGLKIRN